MELKYLKDVPPWEWPRTARETFKQVLRDRRSAASDRIAAAELAGDLTVMDDEMADVLLSVVRSADEPKEVRAKAAISLGPALEEADVEGSGDPIAEPPITEETFRKIQKTLREVYNDGRVPKLVRRRILEASVRAPQDWHEAAVRDAWRSDDEEWKLTAVFGMRRISGFDEQIVNALDSRNPYIHYEAVCAAGAKEVDAAWPHVVALLGSERTPKPLLLAAIEAAGAIRPDEARSVLADLADSDDEEIAEAASEAMSIADAMLDYDKDDDDEDEDSVR